MTDEVVARARVREYLGSDDFELSEFADGWRVILPTPKDFMGVPTLAVERTTGALWVFSSSVPPKRVEEEFHSVKARGHVIDQTAG